jgi:hypothetical protein
MSETDNANYGVLATPPMYPPPRLRIEVEYRSGGGGKPVEPSRIDVEVNHESVDYQMVAGVLDLLGVPTAPAGRGQQIEPAPAYDSGGNFPTTTTYGNSTATTVFPAINDRYLGDAEVNR